MFIMVGRTWFTMTLYYVHIFKPGTESSAETLKTTEAPEIDSGLGNLTSLSLGNLTSSSFGNLTSSSPGICVQFGFYLGNMSELYYVWHSLRYIII